MPDSQNQNCYIKNQDPPLVVHTEFQNSCAPANKDTLVLHMAVLGNNRPTTCQKQQQAVSHHLSDKSPWSFPLSHPAPFYYLYSIQIKYDLMSVSIIIIIIIIIIITIIIIIIIILIIMLSIIIIIAMILFLQHNA
jgi:hypothetical protein